MHNFCTKLTPGSLLVLWCNSLMQNALEWFTVTRSVTNCLQRMQDELQHVIHSTSHSCIKKLTDGAPVYMHNGWPPGRSHVTNEVNLLMHGMSQDWHFFLINS
mmetsp:Transcript_11405/g.21360  ORF Transcript_11405/g.21360 Transcript_11405/m.21360 type:complete len:103 (-) Transcript_11405:163-471(-)